MEIEYRKILKFIFKNNNYQLLLDNNNKYFFLRVNEDTSFSFVTMQELISLHNLFKNFPLVMNAEKKPTKNQTIKLIPKVFFNGVLVPLTLISLLTGCSIFESEYNNNYYKDNSSYNYNNIQRDISFVVEDKQEKLELDTFLESDWVGYTYIYDNDYLDKVFPNKNVTLDMIIQTIDNNSKINERFKLLLKEYITSVYQKYPTAELRIFYENMKTLEIVELDKNQLMLQTLSTTSAGCYVAKDNKIYVLKDYEYIKGTWDYQVIMHEFSHVLRTYQLVNEDNNIRVQIGGLNFNRLTLEEALNSIFTVSLFDYEERDIAYQLQSNYYSIILECMDNYSLEDYTHHSLSYFAQKLDEHTGYNNYASVITELIETQYKDYHSDMIEISQDQYYPIYDFISDIYYNKYLSEEFTYDEAKALTDILVEKIIFDVPEEYNIDINHFYEYLNEYCQKNGVTTGLLK